MIFPEDMNDTDLAVSRQLDENDLVFAPLYIQPNLDETRKCTVLFHIIANRFRNVVFPSILYIDTNLTNLQLIEVLTGFANTRRMTLMKKSKESNLVKDQLKTCSHSLVMMVRKGNAKKQIRFDLMRLRELSNGHWSQYVEEGPEDRDKNCKIQLEFQLENDSSLKIKS